jgi:homocitrate synthase NifV
MPRACASSWTQEQAERLLPLVRRFVTETKRSPETGDLRRFLAEIGHPQTARLQ